MTGEKVDLMWPPLRADVMSHLFAFPHSVPSTKHCEHSLRRLPSRPVLFPLTCGCHPILVHDSPLFVCSPAAARRGECEVTQTNHDT